MINSQLYSQHDQAFYFLISFLDLKYSCVYMLREKRVSVAQSVSAFGCKPKGWCFKSIQGLAWQAYIIKPEKSCFAKTQVTFSMSEM